MLLIAVLALGFVALTQAKSLPADFTDHKNAAPNKATPLWFRPANSSSSCPKNIGKSSECFATSDPVGCYCVINIPSSWDEAQSLCSQRGTELVSIETAAENEAIKQLFATQDNFEKNGGAGLRLWTSGSDKEEQDNWVWTSTGQPIEFTDWRPNEPSKEFDGEDYLDFWFASDSQGWNDAPENPAEFGWEMLPLCEIRANLL